MEEPAIVSESGQLARTKGSELLMLTVDIGDGRQDSIPIYEEDEPESLAAQFVAKHHLSPLLHGTLATLISQNKEIVQMRVASTSPDVFKWSSTSPDKPKDPVNMDEQPELPGVRRVDPVFRERMLKTSGNSVFHRLYRQGKKRTQSSAPGQRKKGLKTVNYGEWLYIKGLKSLETQEKELDKKRVTEEFSFKPQINELSKMIAPRYFEKTEDLLLRKSASYKENLEQKKLERQAEEMKECSFVPKILDKGPRQAKPSHNLLYSEAEKRRQRRELISETAYKLNYAFEPKVNTARARESQEDVADRLINSKKEFEVRMQKIRQEQNEVTENRPKTGRSPLKPRTRGQSVHEHLYSRRNEHKEKLKMINQNSKQYWDKVASSLKTNSHSLKLFQKFRVRQYNTLFNLLDSDGDGKISAQNINLDSLDDKTLEILTPLFGVLDEGGDMNLNLFASYMEELWANLSVYAKGHILRKQKELPLLSEPCTIFTSPKSKAYAARKRALMSPDLYERQLQAYQIKELKTKKIKELNEEAELKECTFKPATKKFRRR